MPKRRMLFAIIAVAAFAVGLGGCASLHTTGTDDGRGTISASPSSGDMTSPTDSQSP